MTSNPVLRLALGICFLGLSFSQPLFGKTEKKLNNFFVDLGEDTVYVCVGQNYGFSPLVSGGTAPYTYLWGSGDTTSSLQLSLPAPDTLTISLRVWDATGLLATDSITVIAYGACVWPGDANGDGIANHTDLLELGRAFGSTGPRRPNAHTNWIGQPSPEWGHFLPGGHDYTYADTDGDGHVGAQDLVAIRQNYAFLPAVPDTSAGSGPPLQIGFPDTAVNAGDTVIAPIILGTQAFPADSVYGIAFSLRYDPALIDSGSVRVRYDNSWLGVLHQEIEAMDRDFYQHGQIDIAITRINQREISGYGRVGDIVIMIDDIAGKNNSVSTLLIELTNVHAIHANGAKIPVSAGQVSLEVYPETESRPETAPPAKVANAFPNPATERFLAESGGLLWERLRVCDLSGREIYRWAEPFEETLEVSTSGWSPGLYIVMWENAQTIVSQRIVVRE